MFIKKLAHTGLRIKDIARNRGFANEFHFSRKFKEAYGQNPRAWRQQNWAQPARNELRPEL